MELSPEQIEVFRRDGVLVLHNFYDLEKDIKPIQAGIYRIISILIKKYNLLIRQKSFSPATFDDGYMELITHDRKIGGEVYDAIKQIPAFIRIVGHSRNEAVAAALRQTDNVGISAGSYGIRIDNPGEEKHLTLWHQEYPSHPRSVDGLVFWSSLVPVTKELGPVEVCVGSHKIGIAKLALAGNFKDISPENFQERAKNMIIHNAEELLRPFLRVTPLTNPGDLIIFDFLTVHRSQRNMSVRPRWSMQIRYFNFEHPSGIKHSWPGGIAQGRYVDEMNPDIVVS